MLRQLKWSYCKHRGLIPRDGICFLTVMALWVLDALGEQVEDGVSILWLPNPLVPSSLENETTLLKSGSAHQVASSSASASAPRSPFASLPGAEPAGGPGEGRGVRLCQAKFPSGG